MDSYYFIAALDGVHSLNFCQVVKTFTTLSKITFLLMGTIFLNFWQVVKTFVGC